MTVKSNSKPTKELILDVAFSFMEKPRYASFSMNELAEKVGITKPAIYRHFENKDAVLDAMEERVLNGIIPFLDGFENLVGEEGKKTLVALIQHFIENPTHVNYIIAQLSSIPSYEEHLYQVLAKKEVYFIGSGTKSTYLENLNKDIKKFARHTFSGMTIFFFVEVAERLKKMNYITKIPSNFADRIVDLLLNGLQGTTKKGDVLHPAGISDSRKKELVELCKINKEILPKENKIFTALAQTIKKYHITGVTVEKIAAELNMAKSSLYEYFDNKNEMIKTLIFRELSLLQTILIENSTEAKNFEEYVYILMLSEFEYFTQRPSVIPICGWLLMSGVDMGQENHETNECENKNSPWELRLPKKINSPDLGFEYSPELITGWIKCLPAAFLVESSGKTLIQEKRMEGFMLTIDYILDGMKVIGGTK